MRPALPELAPVNPFCHTGFGIRLARDRARPVHDSENGRPERGHTAQRSGRALAANYTVANAVVAPSLGRNLSNAAPNVTVNLIPPGSLYGDRINEFDVRFAKS